MHINHICLLHFFQICQHYHFDGHIFALCGWISAYHLMVLKYMSLCNFPKYLYKEIVLKKENTLCFIWAWKKENNIWFIYSSWKEHCWCNLNKYCTFMAKIRCKELSGSMSITKKMLWTWANWTLRCPWLGLACNFDVWLLAYTDCQNIWTVVIV